ncbi:hypothetical protein [Natronorubrum sp. DTA7]|uniref:hypothetical protein n=1 Tax=Natronorubrum sp. DTA7 TaxID=3447016 RepID=UPI003F87210F
MTEIEYDHEVVVDSVNEITSVPIECPGCGESFREALSDRLGGTTCHECKGWIRYVRRAEIRPDRSVEDCTEQSSLPIASTDGGRTHTATEPDDNLETDGGQDLSAFGVDCPEATERPPEDTSEDYKFTRSQCRGLTNDGNRCSNPVIRGGDEDFCPRHADSDCETIDDQLDTDSNDTVRGQALKLKFADKHITPILHGDKTVTLRVGVDSDDFQQGDPILLCDENGDWFAEAGVEDRGYTTVEMAAKMDWDGHHEYSDVDELLEELQGYYPGKEIGPNTRLEVIEWGELW